MTQLQNTAALADLRPASPKSSHGAVEEPIWTDDAKMQLRQLWWSGEPIAVIALLLHRSFASVQTMASRQKLPPRESPHKRHRKRWTMPENAELASLLKTRPTLDVLRFYADKTERTLDAVINHVLDQHGQGIFNEIFLRSTVDKTQLYRSSTLISIPKKSKDSGEKYCRKCMKVFLSPDVKRIWICTPCKSAPDYW